MRGPAPATRNDRQPIRPAHIDGATATASPATSEKA